MKNKKYKNTISDIKILLTLFCFQEEIYQKNSLKNYETPKNSKDKDYSLYIIEKSVMEKYKTFYNYEFLYNFLKSKKSILDCLKDNNIITSEKIKSKEILDKITLQLPDDFINKIKNIDENNKNKLIEEIENENKKEWNYKMIKYENNKLCLKFINEFEIISYELYIYLEGQGFKLSKFLLGNYIIGNQKIFIILKGSGEIFYEIGKIEKDGHFIIEYLFNPKEINNSTLFYKNLMKYGLKLGGNSKEINEILIYNKKYKLYKVNKNKIEEFTEDKNVNIPVNNNNNNSIRNSYKNKNIEKNNSNNNKNLDIYKANKKYEKKIVNNDSNNNNKKVDINNINKANNTLQLNINETLFKSISLYLYYKQIKIKNNTNFEEYYLINKDFINKIIIDIGYKQIYDELNEKLENISENVDDKKKVNDCYNLLDQNIVKEYSNKKFNKIIIKDYEIEPSLIPLNYYDYLEGKQNDSLMIYNDFEIINKNILNLFIQNITECNKNLIECIFNNGKIIINIPNNNLNGNKIVSLIGILEPYYNYFIVEYILIYNNENNRNKHIKEIISNLDEYLNNLNFLNNNLEIVNNNSEKIGTIIKYDNDNNTSYINNDNNNIIIHNNDKVINNLKDKFESCPKIGLQNIGATCYMNSTLQCFSHIEKFVEFFKYNPQINDIVTKNKNNDKNLSVSFKTLIDNLWPDNLSQSTQKYFSPDDFKNKISKMNPLFEGIQANDAKDLVNFIIMTLHLELNKDSKNSESTENQNGQILIGREFESFKKDIFDKNNSIISELFYAINCNITTCSKCGNSIQNYQIYFFINFPLEEVRLYKLNNMNNMNNINYNQNNNNNFIGRSMSVNVNNIQGQYMMVPQNQFNMNMNMNSMYYQQGMYNNYAMNPQTQINNYPNNYLMNQQNQYNNNGMIASQTQPNNTINEVSIYDCFNYDRKNNRMGGENSFFCNNCKGLNEAIMTTNLITGPEVLIIILNRGKGIEFNVKINFTEVLDLSNYIEQKDNGCMYQLIGVITHLGESSMSGHFIAYCRDPINKTSWYKYNDAIVSDVSDFKKEVIDFAMPYLLFYQKV